MTKFKDIPVPTGSPISPEDLRKLKDCFKPVPPPARREDQYYDPADHTWFEKQFNYKVEIPADTSQDTNDSVLFAAWHGDTSHPFFRTKQEMQEDPLRWGGYRESWYGSIKEGKYIWYFMTRNHALEFRLWVDL